MEKHEIIIIGAGPAGLRAARTLAEGGKDVLVLEKNAVIGPKTCAGGLTIKDIEIIPKHIVDAEFNYIILHTRNGAHNLDLGSHPVFTINREKLGQWMAREAEKAGAEIRTESFVSAVKENHLLVNGEEIGYDYLVGADGSNSIVRIFLKLPVKKSLTALHYISKTPRKELEVFLDDFKKCLKYSWIFPHNGFTSIGVGGWTKKASMLRQDLDEMCDRFAVEKTGLEAFPINFDYRGFAFGKRFLAGDAAGFASGLTGEGIYPAILSGEEVARGILNENYGYPEIKQLLTTKNSQEKLRRIFSINRYIPHVFFNNFIPFLLKRRNLGRMINNKYSFV